MTWTTFHRRGETLRSVIEAADRRRDGLLPMDVPGVAETFADELDVLGTLQLRWHTRLAGRIERELMGQPMDLESAVVAAWRATAAELPGVRAILDHYRAEPIDEAMAEAMRIAVGKERILLAVMAGKAGMTDDDEATKAVGARIEEEARTGGPAEAPRTAEVRHCLLDRLRAALVA